VAPLHLPARPFQSSRSFLLLASFAASLPLTGTSDDINQHYDHPAPGVSTSHQRPRQGTQPSLLALLVLPRIKNPMRPQTENVSTAHTIRMLRQLILHRPNLGHNNQVRFFAQLRRRLSHGIGRYGGRYRPGNRHCGNYAPSSHSNASFVLSRLKSNCSECMNRRYWLTWKAHRWSSVAFWGTLDGCELVRSRRQGIVGLK